MKRVIILLMVIVLSSVGLKAQENKINSTRVTYLANSGFLVDLGETVVLFDGLFQNGMDRYLEPTTYTINAIKNGLAPFDNVDIAFVSNKHADHFDPYLAIEFLTNNENAKLICPQQAINKMIIFTSKYLLVKDRIIETTANINNYDRFVIDNIEIFACRAKYEKAEFDHIENISYVVNVDGVKLFHSGDSRPEDLRNMEGINFSDLNIDLAFLNDKYAMGKSAKITNKILDARYNVLMHFEKYVKVKQLMNFAERSNLNSHPHIFKARNEYQDFYINDYFPSKYEAGRLAMDENKEVVNN